jgi:hypothetical protein
MNVTATDRCDMTERRRAGRRLLPYSFGAYGSFGPYCGFGVPATLGCAVVAVVAGCGR